MELSNSDKEFVSSSMERIFGGLDIYRYTFAEVLLREILHVSEFPHDSKNLTERYFNRDHFKGLEEGDSLWGMLIIMVHCAFVLKKVTLCGLTEASKSDFLAKYPKFNGLNEHEINLLLEFWRYMTCALGFIPAKNNKRLLILVAGYLESGKEYVTGSGQSPATSRRVEIYVIESGVTAVRRPTKRARDPSEHREETDCNHAPPAKKRRSPPHITLARVQRIERTSVLRGSHPSAAMLQTQATTFCEPIFAPGSITPVSIPAMVQVNEIISPFTPARCDSRMTTSTTCGNGGVDFDSFSFGLDEFDDMGFGIN